MSTTAGLNIIVIVTDSMRADHLGCYGNPWISTPSLDRFAADATLFEQAYPEGMPTGPVRHAFWTGRYTFPFMAWQPFDPEERTLAEVMWDQGYSTSLITDVYHLHKPGTNWGRGFDSVRFIRGQEYDPFVVDPSIPVDLTARHKLRGDDTDAMWRPRFEQHLRNISGWDWWRSDEDHFVAQTAKAAIDWLESHKGQRRQLLWVDCFDPHEPWDPPEPYNRMYCPDHSGPDLVDPVPGPVEGYLNEREMANVRAQYAGEVTLVDKWVGQLLGAAESLGYFDDSLIIYTTDHGEPFGEHGIVRKARPWPYEEQVHIPWLLRLPDDAGRGARLDAFVETVDMMPTLLDFAGLQGPPDMHGQSLLPLVRGQAESLRDYGYAAWHGSSWSIRNLEWSYIQWLRAPERDADKPELYNRRSDPQEQHNVIADHPDVARELQRRLMELTTRLRQLDRE